MAELRNWWRCYVHSRKIVLTSCLAFFIGLLGVVLSGHSIVFPAGRWVVLPMRSVLVVGFAVLVGTSVMTRSDFDSADTGILQRSRIIHFWLALFFGSAFFVLSERFLIDNGWPRAYVAMYAVLYSLSVVGARLWGSGKSWILPLVFYLFTLVVGTVENSTQMAWWSPLREEWGSAVAWVVCASLMGRITLCARGLKRR